MKSKYIFLFLPIIISNIYPIAIANQEIKEIDISSKKTNTNYIYQDILKYLREDNFKEASNEIIKLLVTDIRRDKNSIDNAFLLVILSSCLSKNKDVSSYKAWNMAINIYLKNNSSWEIERKELKINSNKYDYETLNSMLDLVNYYGPELDLSEKNSKIATDLKNIDDVLKEKKKLSEIDYIYKEDKVVVKNNPKTTEIKKVIPTPSNYPKVDTNILIKTTPSPKIEIPKITPSPTTSPKNIKPKEPEKKNVDIKNEMDIAKTAWKYFEANYNTETGMVDSSIKYSYTTMWDLASGLAMLPSAEKLGVIDKITFDKYLKKILSTLSTIKLYKNELPNREYKTTNGHIAIGANESNIGSGWSAIDLGRTLIWLKIIKNWYPEYSKDIDKIVSKWNFKRLSKDDQMNGTYHNGQSEVLRQEGRVGYEQYAANGFLSWNILLKKALDYEPSKNIKILDTELIYDTRNVSYFTSEPFFLAKMEIGFIDPIFEKLTTNIYEVQKKRWSKFGAITSITEDSIDQYPWFVYNSISFAGKPWLCTNSGGKSYPDLKTISTKSSFAWNAIFNDSYSNMLKEKVLNINNSKYGYYSGIYEKGNKVNKSININTNAVILESLLYEKLGRKPFLTIK